MINYIIVGLLALIIACIVVIAPIAYNNSLQADSDTISNHKTCLKYGC